MASSKNSSVKMHIEYANSYYSDINRKDMHYAVIIRSPISEGTLRYLRLPDIPPYCTLITADDIPGVNEIDTLGSKIPLLAHDNISWKGEPLGLLCGPDLAELYQLLPQLDFRFSRARIAESQNSKKSNTQKILAKRIVIAGDAESEYLKESTKVENTYNCDFHMYPCSETDGAFCFYKAHTINVYIPTRWPWHLKENLSAVLGRDCTNILLNKTIQPNEDTTNIYTNTVVAAQCSLASMITKKPIMLSLGAKEQELYYSRSLPISIRHKLSADSTGHITADMIRMFLDVGAYNPGIQNTVDRLAACATGLYSIPNLKIEVFALSSQHSPASIIPEQLDAHVFFAIECQLQELARRLQKNPLELRLENLNNKKLPADYPFKLELQIENTLELVQTMSDFNRRYLSYNYNPLRLNNLNNPLPFKGMGLACAYQGACFAGSQNSLTKYTLEMTMDINGKVTIHAYRPSENIIKIWKKIVTETLNITFDDIQIDMEVNEAIKQEYPETMTSDISIMTILVKRCCNGIKKQRFRDPLPLTVKRTINIARPTRWSQKNFSGYPFFSISGASVAVLVEMNPFTCEFELKNIWIAVEGGSILDESEAIKTIHTEVQKCLKNNFYIDSNCPIEVKFIPKTTEPKQIGFLVRNALPEAIANGVSQIIQNQINTYPFAPQLIYEYLKNDEELL